MTAAIEVENLRCEFRVHTGLLTAEKRVVAVDDVTFACRPAACSASSASPAAANPRWRA